MQERLRRNARRVALAVDRWWIMAAVASVGRTMLLVDSPGGGWLARRGKVARAHAPTCTVVFVQGGEVGEMLAVETALCTIKTLDSGNLRNICECLLAKVKDASGRKCLPGGGLGCVSECIQHFGWHVVAYCA